jgi:hypothetical protein
VQGNIIDDPQFLDPADEGMGESVYQLEASSPGVNAGSNQAWMAQALDLAGRTRLKFGRVDMGAYEVQTMGKGSIFIIF